MTLRSNPYLGPRTFEESDGELFFGRDYEAAELLSFVISEPLTLFYAQSGAGKSSLINARLVPGLRSENFRVLPIGRVGGSLPDGVADEDNIFIFNLLLSLDQGRTEPSILANMTLARFLHDLIEQETSEAQPVESERVSFVLIVDQFEEVFTAYPDRWQARRPFFEQLSEAIDTNPSLWIVLSLREDYLASLDPFSGLFANALQDRFHLEKMRANAALLAIQEPAKQGGRPFAPSVAEALVDNLRQVRSQRPDETSLGEFVEPVQLQVVCYQLWEKLSIKAEAVITLADLEELGNVDHALGEFYQQALSEALVRTKVSELELRNWFEYRLITEAGTRGIVFQGSEQTAGMPNAVVQILALRFLLISEQRAGAVWYELIHDRFVEPILQSNHKWRIQQSPLLQAAIAWNNSGKSFTKLLQGDQLKEATTSVSTRDSLEPLVQEFLAASEQVEKERNYERAQNEADQQRKRAEERERVASRLRSVTIGLIIALLLAAIATVWAIQGQIDAQRNSELAGTRAAESERNADLLATSEAEVRANAALEATRQAKDVTMAQEETVRQQSISFAGTLATSAQELSEESDNRHLALLLIVEAVDIYEQLAPQSLGLTLIDNLHDLLSRYNEGQEVATGDAAILTIGFDSNASSWVSVALDGTLTLTDSDTGESESYQIQENEVPIVAAELSPMADKVVISRQDQSIYVHTHATRTTDRLQLDGLSGDWPVKDFSFSDDGRFLALLTADQILIQDLSTQSIVQSLEPNKSWQSIALSADGQMLVSTGFSQDIYVWDLNTPSSAPLNLARVGKSSPGVSRFSPDGKLLAVAVDQYVNVWSVTKLDRGPRILVADQSPISTIAFSQDSTHIAAGNTDGDIFVWDVRSSNRAPITLLGHESSANSLAFDSTGTRLLSGDLDGAVRIWDLQSSVGGPTVRELPDVDILAGHGLEAGDIAYSPDGSLIAVMMDGVITIWDQRESTIFAEPEAILPHVSTVFDELDLNTGSRYTANSLDFSADGTLLASAYRGNQVLLWDIRALGTEPTILEGHDRTVNSVVFSPVTNLLASASDDGTIGLWDLTVGTGIAETFLRSDFRRRLWTLAFSPDGMMLAASDVTGSIYLWDMGNQTREPVVIDAHEAWINALAFSPDGEMLASGGDDRLIKLWDVNDLRRGRATQLLQIAEHKGNVNSLVFIGNERLSSSSLDGTVRLWTISNGDYVQSSQLNPATNFDNPSQIFGLAIDPAQTRLASIVEGNLIHAWLIDQNELTALACRLAGRNFQSDEWEHYLTGIDPRLTCPNQPIPMSFIQMLIREGQESTVLSALERLHDESIIEEDPTPQEIMGEAYEGLAREYAREGEVDSAFDAIDKAVMYDSLAVTNPQELVAAGLVGWAGQLSRDGRATDALAVLEQALELDPLVVETSPSAIVSEQLLNRIWITLLPNNRLLEAYLSLQEAASIDAHLSTTSLEKVGSIYQQICERGRTDLPKVTDFVEDSCKGAMEAALVTDSATLSVDVCRLLVLRNLENQALEVCGRASELALQSNEALLNYQLCLLTQSPAISELVDDNCNLVSRERSSAQLKFSETQMDSISPEDTHIWRFSAESGLIISLSLTYETGLGFPDISVLDPSGAVLSDLAANDGGPVYDYPTPELDDILLMSQFQLPIAGEYSIVVTNSREALLPYSLLLIPKALSSE